MSNTTLIDAPLFVAPAARLGEAEPVPPLGKPDWPNGLRLLPEHFSAQDRYHEDFVRHALRMAFDQPWWGISELVIDEEALSAGQLRVTRLRATLSDTTPILAGISGAIAVPARNIARQLHAHPKLDVYVGLPLEGSRPGAFDPKTGAPKEPRYVQEIATVADHGTGRSPTKIPWGRPNLRLLLDDEPLDAYAAIPIARIHQAQGRAQLDPSFVPPVLRVRASATLEDRLRRIEKSVLAAKATVGEHRRTNAEMTGGDAARLLVAMTLGRLLPSLQGALAADAAHPREAYRAVAELAGTLSAFTPAGNTKIPAFDFLDLSTTFDVLEESVRSVLEAIAGPTQRIIPLERHDDHLWRAYLREAGIFGREFLLVVSGMAPASLHANFPRAAKVAAFEDMGETLQHALPGVALVPEIRRPQGIALPPQSACFRVDKRGPSWAGVVKHGSMALWLPTGFASLKPMLLTQEPGVFGG